MTTLFSRRTFLTTSAVSSVVFPIGQTNTVMAHDLCECPTDPIPSPEDEIKIRRDIYSLDVNGPEITAFRNGVAAMQQRPVTDPTSWLFQANIHGTVDSPPPSLPTEALETWSTCEHGSYFFLSWHRMYLFFFERILRAASGDENFALPYWNYVPPAQRALPQALREPGDANNSLFVAARRTANPDINGGEAVPDFATVSTQAMNQTFYGSPSEFGFTWELERQPHNIMHVVLGGSGWMSDPDLAARDPVFWLHHANIDRLWSQWLRLGGGRENPLSDPLWRDTAFAFYDETGTRVEMTGADIVDTVEQLGHRYDDELPTEAGLTMNVQSDQEAASAAIELAAQPEGASTTLGVGRTTVSLGATIESGPESFTTPQAAGAKPVLLELSGIDYERSPSVWYEVYINLPEDVSPQPNNDYYAGSIAFFAQAMSQRQRMRMQGQHGPERLDVSGLLNRQVESGLWRGGDIKVTFIARGSENPGIEATPVGEHVTINSIRIVRP